MRIGGWILSPQRVTTLRLTLDERSVPHASPTTHSHIEPRRDRLTLQSVRDTPPAVAGPHPSGSSQTRSLSESKAYLLRSTPRTEPSSRPGSSIPRCPAAAPCTRSFLHLLRTRATPRSCPST